MLLFNVGEDALRPFLVCTLNEDGSMNGELFLDYLKDRPAEWVRRNVFQTIHRDYRTVYVEKVREGLGVGQARFQAQREETAPKNASTIPGRLRPIKAKESL